MLPDVVVQGMVVVALGMVEVEPIVVFVGHFVEQSLAV